MNYREDEIRKREQLEIQNIEMIDCSQEEIADAVDEMYLRLENQWNDTEDIKLLQKNLEIIIGKIYIDYMKINPWHIMEK